MERFSTMKPPFVFLAFGLLPVLVACKPHPAPAVQDAATQARSQTGLVGHWVCTSSQMPTGLFLFRTFDFHADGTFRSIDSMVERPPVRVWDGTWNASDSSITAKLRTWRVGAEETVDTDDIDLGYRFIDQTKSAFETTIPYSDRSVDFICGSSLDDIEGRHLNERLEQDIARHRAGQ
jgi:hypothetical protein